jgi:DnaJ-class molecular chaperone
MDYYNKLGVNKSASQDEIKRAYKKLAMKHHPDRGGDQKTFQEINEAYDTLKDNEKRYMYDNPQTRQQFNFNTGNMNDMFSQFFRQTQRVRKNSSMSITVRISLKDVVTGKDVVGKYMLGSGKQEVVNIRIPPGVEDGLTMRYAGLGDNSVKQLPRGDLHVRIVVEKHKHFVRDRSHLL